jgi:prevent-host-death family protein
MAGHPRTETPTRFLRRLRPRLGRGRRRRTLSGGVSTVLFVAARREDLTEEQQALQRAYQRSWGVAQEFLADSEKRAWLEANIERVRQSPTTRITREEFLAATEPIVTGSDADGARSGYHGVMEVATSTEVGIRDLKNGLSKYLERVRAGEEVIVTDRGRPVARLSAIDESTDRLADLVAAGVVRAPTRKTRRRPTRRIEAKGPVSDLVSEQRR